MAIDTQPRLLSGVEERLDQDRPPSDVKPIGDRQRFRRFMPIALPFMLVAAAGIAVTIPETLPTNARLTLFAFALATILWSITKINAAYLALLVVMLLIISGGTSQDRLFDALGSDVIWLMVGAFVLGGALTHTGLAGRLTSIVLRRPTTVGGVFWMITTILLPLSIFVPSTSGRAAVVLPLFRTLSDLLGDRRITRALALLIPTVILVSTISTVIGAASHLIGLDLLRQVTGGGISFAQWAFWGVPFGVTAAYVSCWVVSRMFLDGDSRRRPLPRSPRTSPPGTLSRDEKVALLVLVVMVCLWLTESWHGLEVATVTVAGALVLTLPGIGVMSWKQGLTAVSWNLVIFVGAALALGGALVDTGAGQWIIDRLFAVSGVAELGTTFLVLLAIAGLSLTSHLYLTSHTVRAVALVPPFLYLATSLDLNATAVLFIATVGMDFCLTLPVSSKAILVFQETEVETFTPADLIRLSAVLMAAHVVLMIIFYYGFWQWTGLAL